ncbi:MAG: hypothetical protein OCD02_21450 [Spirochaetaceae bacterium]
MKKIIILILISLLSLQVYSQDNTDKQEAYDNAIEAIKIMDSGEIDKSIGMLKNSQLLDPENYIYPYEIAYAHFLKKDYGNAISILEDVIQFKNKTDQCFTLLGNIYDMDGKPEKAIEVYKKGLVLFPTSGRLYFEQGNVQEVLGKYNEALVTWENGVYVDPRYASNYHTSAIYYSNYTTEKIWGILYGELFINLERGSDKTEQISKLLYDTYMSSIEITSNAEVRVNFTQTSTVILDEDVQEKNTPFPISYELTLAVALIPELKEENFGMKSLYNIRKLFIEEWFKYSIDSMYPNILFDWHKKLIELGYFESYNYWLFMKGNEDEFRSWLSENEDKYNSFIQWFSDNPMSINENNRLHRYQY